MTKRLLLTVCLLCSMLSGLSFEWKMGNFNYDERTCAVIGWEGYQPVTRSAEIPRNYYLGETYFTVTEITPGACDNLTQIESLTISENIRKIGRHDLSTIADIENFRNCPKLKKFIVSASNPVLSNDTRGVLTNKDGHSIIRVPQMVETQTNGLFVISTNTPTIYPQAFAGNSSIKTIRIPGETFYFERPLGFNSMVNLESFDNSPLGNEVAVYNGCLYTRSMKTLISMPPKRGITSFVPSPLTVEVADEALANTSSLRELELKNIRKFGKEALRGSAIEQFELPNENVVFGEGMLRDCRKLKSLTVYYSCPIPRDFARGSGLERVSLLGTSDIGKAAFKNCKSLTYFSFGPNNRLDSDSIFAGSGLVNVEYAAGAIPTEGFPMGKAMFADCKELTQVDMSRLVIPAGTEWAPEVANLFVANCPKLEKVIFPRVVSLVGNSDGNTPNFGYDSPLKTLVIKAFYKTPSPAFIYTEGVHTPAVFLLTSDPQVNSWPMRTMFKTEGENVNLRPHIFCESYNMLLTGSHTYDFISPNSSYYIPGGTWENYRQAENEGCTTLEMFQIYFEQRDGKIKVRAQPVLDFVEMLSVTVDNSDYTEFNSIGIAQTNTPMSTAQNITVEYNVQGTRFKTIYPVKDVSSAESVEDDYRGQTQIAIDGRTVRFGEIASYIVVDLSGKVIATGNGHCVELPDAAPGVYLLSLTSAGNSPRNEKILLR